MKAKRILCLVLAASLLLGGCSQKPSDNSSHSQKGRYVEKSMPLPEGAKGNIFLTKLDNTPFLYSFMEEPFSITGFRLEKDGTWTEATPEWIKSLSPLPKGYSYQSQIMEDGNGYQYLYYTELINTSLKPNLICSKDGKSSEVLKPEGWEEVNPDYGNYNFPSQVTMLEDGSLSALYYTREVSIYDPVNQTLSDTQTNMNFNVEFLGSIGSKLILAENDDNGRLKAIVLQEPGASDSTSYPIETKIDSSLFSDVDGKDLLICNADGIFRLEEGTSIWNTVLDGTLTSLAMPTLSCLGFVCDADARYYVLYRSASYNYSLKQYVFDETIDKIPSKELNVYALTDNSTLRQTASVFQQTHPDVKVNFTTAMTREEFDMADTSIKEDYIRALNTELLAGSNYDILVLDGLPAASFLEKGVLAEISDLIQPMIDDGTLLKNIIDPYVENGKLYRFPARYGLPILYGRMNTSLTSLEALSEYAARTESSIFGQITMADFINTFASYPIGLPLEENGKINRAHLISLLNTLKPLAENCGIIDSYKGISIRGNNIWNISRGDYLSLNTTKSFLDAIFPFGMSTHFKGGYTSFANSYQPICELGIVSKSKQVELSKEFLRTVLSEDIQKNDLYDGFPINAKALDTSAKEDRSMFSVGTSVQNEDGSEEMLALEALDQAQTADLVSICSQVNYRLAKDEHITSAIIEKAADFFTGSMTAEDAADAIIEKMNIYLSE